MMLPIVRPHFPSMYDMDADWLYDFRDCLDTGKVTNGKWVREFELALGEYLGCGVVAFCNGQTALMAMLMAAGVHPEDEVVLPSFTFVGTPHAVAALGAVPMFADIDPDTLTMDWGSANALVGERTAAVLGVDVYGIRWGRMYHSAAVPTLCDSAPAFGSMVEGSPVSAYTRIFSFHATKPFSTMEGGCVASHDEDFLARVRRIREFGQDDERNCVGIGLNGKMTEVCALVGLANLETWEERRKKRIFSAAKLRYRLRGVGTVYVFNDPPGQEPVWTYMPILAETNQHRGELLASLREHGVDARTYYTACHKIPLYDSGLKLPVAEDIAARVIALPLYDEMTDEEMNWICEALA